THPIACVLVPVLGGFAVTMGGIAGLHGIPPLTDPSDPTFVYSSNTRWSMYGLVSVGMGAIAAPITAYAMTRYPWAFPAATVLSLSTMVASGFYALRQPNASLLKYRAPLIGVLGGFVGMGFLSLGSYLVLGPNALSEIW